MCILYFYISDILQYKNTDPNPAYPGEFLQINNQRAHNNYENIILKEPNNKNQRAHLGPRAPLWTTLLYSTVYLITHYTVTPYAVLAILKYFYLSMST